MRMAHYSGVIMNAMVSQIACVSIVYSTVCSDTDQRKHQSSASLALVRGIHRWPVSSPHKGPVTQKVSIRWRHHEECFFSGVIPGILVFLKIFKMIKNLIAFASAGRQCKVLNSAQYPSMYVLCIPNKIHTCCFVILWFKCKLDFVYSCVPFTCGFVLALLVLWQ